MRLQCTICEKVVSNEISEEVIIRAALVCPECIAAKRVGWPLISYGTNGEEKPKQ